MLIISGLCDGASTSGGVASEPSATFDGCCPKMWPDYQESLGIALAIPWQILGESTGQATLQGYSRAVTPGACCRQQSLLLSAMEASPVQPTCKASARHAASAAGHTEAAVKGGMPLHTGPAARMAAGVAAIKNQAPVGLETEDSSDDKCAPLTPSDRAQPPVVNIWMFCMHMLHDPTRNHDTPLRCCKDGKNLA